MNFDYKFRSKNEIIMFNFIGAAARVLFIISAMAAVWFFCWEYAVNDFKKAEIVVLGLVCGFVVYLVLLWFFEVDRFAWMPDSWAVNLLNKIKEYEELEQYRKKVTSSGRKFTCGEVRAIDNFYLERKYNIKADIKKAAEDRQKEQEACRELYEG